MMGKRVVAIGIAWVFSLIHLSADEARLSSQRVWLEAPEAALEVLPIPSEQTEWKFRGWTLREVQDFIKNLGMSDGLLNRLYFESGMVDLRTEVRIYPPMQAVIDLPQSIRSRIYTTLYQISRTGLKNLVILEDDISLQEHFGPSFPPDLLPLVEEMTWKLYGQSVFSDFEVLLANIPEGTTELDLLRAMSRSQTLMVKVHLHRPIAPEWKQYWSRNGRDQGIVEIMQSVDRMGQGVWFDAAHLLPLDPKQNLYTYPNPTSGVEGGFPDGFSTAFNFFSENDDPLPVIRDQNLLRAIVEEDYLAVDRAPKYGDLILFEDAQSGELKHGAIYIADEIVYTKNSPNILTPWVLMRIPDVALRFPTENGLKIRTMEKRQGR